MLAFTFKDLVLHNQSGQPFLLIGILGKVSFSAVYYPQLLQTNYITTIITTVLTLNEVHISQQFSGPSYPMLLKQIFNLIIVSLLINHFYCFDIEYGFLDLLLIGLELLILDIKYFAHLPPHDLVLIPHLPTLINPLPVLLYPLSLDLFVDEGREFDLVTFPLASEVHFVVIEEVSHVLGLGRQVAVQKELLFQRWQDGFGGCEAARWVRLWQGCPVLQATDVLFYGELDRTQEEGSLEFLNDVFEICEIFHSPSPPSLYCDC